MAVSRAQENFEQLLATYYFIKGTPYPFQSTKQYETTTHKSITQFFEFINSKQSEYFDINHFLIQIEKLKEARWEQTDDSGPHRSAVHYFNEMRKLFQKKMHEEIEKSLEGYEHLCSYEDIRQVMFLWSQIVSIHAASLTGDESGELTYSHVKAEQEFTRLHQCKMEAEVKLGEVRKDFKAHFVAGSLGLEYELSEEELGRLIEICGLKETVYIVKDVDVDALIKIIQPQMEHDKFILPLVVNTSLKENSRVSDMGAHWVRAFIEKKADRYVLTYKDSVKCANDQDEAIKKKRIIDRFSKVFEKLPIDLSKVTINGPIIDKDEQSQDSFSCGFRAFMLLLSDPKFPMMAPYNKNTNLLTYRKLAAETVGQAITPLEFSMKIRDLDYLLLLEHMSLTEDEMLTAVENNKGKLKRKYFEVAPDSEPVKYKFKPNKANNYFEKLGTDYHLKKSRLKFKIKKLLDSYKGVFKNGDENVSGYSVKSWVRGALKIFRSALNAFSSMEKTLTDAIGFYRDLFKTLAKHGTAKERKEANEAVKESIAESNTDGLLIKLSTYGMLMQRCAKNVDRNVDKEIDKEFLYKGDKKKTLTQIIRYAEHHLDRYENTRFAKKDKRQLVCNLLQSLPIINKDKFQVGDSLLPAENASEIFKAIVSSLLDSSLAELKQNYARTQADRPLFFKQKKQLFSSFQATIDRILDVSDACYSELDEVDPTDPVYASYFKNLFEFIINKITHLPELDRNDAVRQLREDQALLDLIGQLDSNAANNRNVIDNLNANIKNHIDRMVKNPASSHAVHEFIQLLIYSQAKLFKCHYKHRIEFGNDKQVELPLEASAAAVSDAELGGLPTLYVERQPSLRTSSGGAVGGYRRNSRLV